MHESSLSAILFSVAVNQCSLYDRLYDRSGDGKHCRKNSLGMHFSGVQRDSLGDPLFATRGHAVASPCKRQL